MKKIVGLLLCMFIFTVNSNEFVVKKNKKSTSLPRLKEQCCQLFSQVLKEIPQALRALTKEDFNKSYINLVADFQDCALLAIEGYVENEKKGFCIKASKEQLKIAQSKLNRASGLLRTPPTQSTFKELKGILEFLRI